MGVWSGAFLLLSALDHLVVVLPRVNALYNRLLCRNRNPFRWAEYSVSAAIMSVMIAQLCGVTDIHLVRGAGWRERLTAWPAAQPACTLRPQPPRLSTSPPTQPPPPARSPARSPQLFTIFALMATTMLFGWQMESVNGDSIPTFEYTDDPRACPVPSSKVAAADGGLPLAGSFSAPLPLLATAGPRRVDWTPFVFGCWPFLAATLVTACYFFQAVSNGSPPDFVW